MIVYNTLLLMLKTTIKILSAPERSETFAKRPLLPNFCVRLKF